MPSPFPGMNPYFETADSWRDFHNNFLMTLQKILAEKLSERYFVKCEVRVVFHERSADERFSGIAIADAGILSDDHPRPGPTTATITAPVRLMLPAVEEERERWLEVIEGSTRRVVTVIELLSPSNKTNGRGREEYLAKRLQVLRSDSHFVEIDLRRGGLRPAPPELPVCDYCMLVSRREDRPAVGVWPVALRDELPVIPVPLLEPDSPIQVNLQELLNETYDRVRYERVIYRNPPEPPLSPEDEAWASGLIPAGRGPNAVSS
ncbi:DUF4058 family protein [Zavarzinella formosa]|uniref:DUF4058 family protein n=1 Tax=Zavarzinella formosa TaxID=360055 RepID=UPI00031D6FC9|nr:DUF4058 family protein [Zavarzinella formosa]